jgi:hypothetical protein
LVTGWRTRWSDSWVVIDTAQRYGYVGHSLVNTKKEKNKELEPEMEGYGLLVSIDVRKAEVLT